jgi:hypothetical protein
VPIRVNCRANDKKKKNENIYDSMSIREFLTKQRLEILRLREANRETIENGENRMKDFLMKRSYGKMKSSDEHSKTLDLRHELL